MIFKVYRAAVFAVLCGPVGAGFGYELKFLPITEVMPAHCSSEAGQLSKGELTMGKYKRLLILEMEAPPTDRKIGGEIDRRKVFKAITSSKSKIRHDSGGRFIVIETSREGEKELKERISGARIVKVDKDLKDSIPDLSPTEQLFLDALKLRGSKDYRDLKRLRVIGETPEEQELLTGSCIREEY